MSQRIFRSIFGMGYLMVLFVAVVPLKIELHKITIDIVNFEFHFDQILHAIVYMLICLYYALGEYLGLKLFEDKSFKKFLVAIMILAMGTEIVQLAVPYRAFNIFDLTANLVGIGFGVAIIWIMGRLKAEGFRRQEEFE